MSFIQIIEIETADFAALERLHEEWLAATEGQRTVVREQICRDLERPNTYLVIVEFPSVEAANINNDLPATARIAEGMAALATSPLQFRNLESARPD